MLTAEGCLARRRRFLDRLRPSQPLLLSHPILLRYLANFHVDPFQDRTSSGQSSPRLF